MAPTQIIRGLPFPKAPWISAKNIEDTQDYVPHDGDIIIASYPKTGTNWLQYIVFQIISNGEFFPNFNECTLKHAPLLEIAGTAVLENLDKPRIYKHHCPYNMVQKNKAAKYIYIYRKPEDTIISYYHFARNLGLETPELDEFFEDFISGNIGYGHYFDHVLSYFDHKDDENVLLVSYEKLLLNRRDEVLRIAKYLGDEYFQILSKNDSVMNKVLEHTSFDYMKKNLSVTQPGEKGTERKVDFFRKGTIGDGKQSLKPDQLKRLKDLEKKKLEGIDLLKEWLNE
ncbi:sulfotransferase 1B1-like [Argiope bruennichi]|uniref:Sulfotransferase family cytosolic 1B member 1 like protein n=1 Tax=Argiope bruennichi TaxID=94029 RepID=A0A8T0F7Z8_ARGBR|nr:sulfotransferase 1B1-like [Argiope bruennichi]XP_055941126.1 sulfotransferase 1B1-like [Argiope bruennichi]XP_055941128.1 sulfotransferase 1B1-like [Argiope bruennichi]KAF8787316.1 Sulfotransferase family cytosolic 1B member 1 like protein [Argiope bruennichi]